MGDTCRYAVVTGANKGIGFETVKQLTNSGVTVVLTARNEKRGMEATSLLNEQGFSNVVFHQLDGQDAQSIESLEEFIQTQYGRLAILVNNAGAGGVVPDEDVLRALKIDLVDWLMPNEETRKELGDIENLTEDRIDEILQSFLHDLKQDALEVNGWQMVGPAYCISKLALNAYAIVLARNYPKMCMCPSWIRQHEYKLAYRNNFCQRRSRRTCHASSLA